MMKMGHSGRAAPPTSLTQHSEARPLACAGASPNLWVIPDVNPWLRFPRKLCGPYCLSMRWVHSCGRSCLPLRSL